MTTSPTVVTATITATKTIEATSSPQPPTATAHPTRTPPPTATFTPTPELLACPEVQRVESSPVQILYTKQDAVWLWDETSGEKTQVSLPEDADAPVISADGRFIAYTAQGQSFDTPDHPVPEIPLWVFDRESGQSFEVAVYSTNTVRALYPEAPNIYLMLEWLADTHRLLVQVYLEPWGDGTLQPTGELYLVDAERRSSKFLLPAGSFERISFRPDGGQIAALDTAARDEEGNVNFDAVPDGQLSLIDAATGAVTFRLATRLYEDPWAMFAPVYSPDGKFAGWNSENGFAIVNTQTGKVHEIPLKNTCLPESCYWTDYLPIYWKPDSRSFYTLTTLNDFWDERAETTLYEVFVEPAPRVEKLSVIHANTWSFYFSDDRRYLSYWNQPDHDSKVAGTSIDPMNWITFYIMDMEQREPRLYTEEFLLRNFGWNPNNRQFIYSYSDHGGSTTRMSRLALGDICQHSRAVDIPHIFTYQRIQWIDEERFLAWGVPGAESSGGEWLYLFRLNQEGEPVQIGEVAQNPYDSMSRTQVVVITK